MTASLTSTINRANAGRAFTLAEALIASVVLSLGVCGIATALIASTQSSRATRQSNDGLSLARSMMETLAAKPIDTTDSRACGGTAASPTLAVTYANFADTVAAPSDPATIYQRNSAVTFVRRPVTPVLISSGGPNVYSTLTQTPAADLAVVNVTLQTPGGASVTVARLATRVQKR